MRFSCENCHAKYQVADEKVAGKTIRMKCRKCAHSIEVKPVQAGVAVEPDFGALAGLAATEQHVAAPVTRMGEGFAAHSVMGGAFPGPDAAAVSRSPFDSSPGFDRAPESLRLALGAPEGSELPAHFWYVAIGGAPVGPIAMAEVIAKAREGAINDRSLAWREGLAEWAPIGNLPELVEAIGPALHHASPKSIAMMAAASPVASAYAAPAPAPVHAPAPAAPPAAPAARPAAPAPEAPKSPSGAALRTLASHELSGDLRALLDAPARGESRSAPAPVEVHVQPITRPSALSESGESEFDHRRPSKSASGTKPFPLLLAAVVGASLGFGAGRVTAPAPPVPEAVAASVQTARVAPPHPGDDKLDEVPPPPPVEKPRLAPVQAPPVAAPASAPRPAPSVAQAAPSAAPAPAPEPRPAQTVPSSAAPPPPSMGPSFGGGGASLTEGQIAMVLSQRKIQLRRACWERIENHDTAVKVLATVNIEGNGRVSSVDASGSDAAVTACIRQQIKEWAFPATGAPTTATLPFSFVSQ